MKSILTSLAVLVFVSAIKADTYTLESSGNWNVESNWDTYPGTTIDADDEVILSADVIINASVIINGNLIVSTGSTLTNNWLLSVNGSMTNDGAVINSTQVNLFGDCISNGTWENTEDGSLIVTGTGDFACYGTFINNGGLLGYNSSKFYLAANFENNDYITFNGDFDVKHSAGQEFINNGLAQFNAGLRLEGKLINQVGNNFNVNWSSTMIIADNGWIENYGTVNIEGILEMSSLLDAQSVLGHIVVTGVLTDKPSIAEIL